MNQAERGFNLYWDKLFHVLSYLYYAYDIIWNDVLFAVSCRYDT